jgi:hypothetical protein
MGIRHSLQSQKRNPSTVVVDGRSRKADIPGCHDQGLSSTLRLSARTNESMDSTPRYRLRLYSIASKRGVAMLRRSETGTIFTEGSSSSRCFLARRSLSEGGSDTYKISLPFVAGLPLPGVGVRQLAIINPYKSRPKTMMFYICSPVKRPVRRVRRLSLKIRDDCGIVCGPPRWHAGLVKTKTV